MQAMEALLLTGEMFATNTHNALEQAIVVHLVPELSAKFK